MLYKIAVLVYWVCYFMPTMATFVVISYKNAYLCDIGK